VAMARRPPRRGRPRRERHGVLGTVMEGVGDIAQSIANDVVPGVVDSLDVDELVQREDIQELLGRLDLDAILARIDVGQIIERVDLDAALANVDLNALLARVDIDALLARTEIGELVTRSGTAIAMKGLDEMRSQCVGLDALLDRWVERLLRRRSRAVAVTPAGSD
jgi:hypothetical protein